jgi:hypothetical protein
MIGSRHIHREIQANDELRQPSTPGRAGIDADRLDQMRIYMRLCLDAVGFTSIHMCWSGLEWNLN